MLHHMLRAAAQRAFNVLDPYFQYVTMLLHGDGTNGAQNNTFLDSSTNNFTITRNGNTTQGTFSPYGSNWSYNSGTSSTDYLTTASNAAFAFGTGDFTMEAFVFATASQTDNWIIGLASNCWFRVGSGGALEFYNSVASTSTLASSALPLNTWTHVAVVRSGTALTIYQNGVSVGSATVSTNFSTSVACTIGNQVGFDRRWNGYISNARVVKGTAVYTSAFTPPTSPLTAITNTSLLTCQSNRFIDNSSNAFALTVSGSPSVQRFSPFSPTTAYSTSVIGGSAYFDGTGDYLTVPSSADFGFSTGDFTVECWVYPLSSAAQRLVFFSNDMNNLDIGFSPANTFQYYNGSVVNTGISAASQQWFHFAASRTSGTTSVYVNGVRTNNVSDTSSTTTRSVLVASSSGTFPFNGYINDVRIIKGTGIYSGTTITVPTAPLTAVTNTKLLLNYTNAGILDNAMMNNLETVGNAQISTSVKKYGTGSMSFDGSGDYLISRASPIWLLSGDWTMEAWIYPTNVTGVHVIFETRNRTTNASPCLYINGTNLVIDTGTAAVVSAGTITINTWQHVAGTRSGNSWRIFINGTQVGATTTNTTAYTSYYGCCIGSSYYNEDFAGYIDEARITNGYARYTASFTAPTQAFPNN